MTDDLAPAAAVRVVAHAKINLLLRVLAREANGYHGVETLFQAIELADIVTLRVGGTTRTLTCDGPAMPPTGLGTQEQNLAFRAAVAYANAHPDHWPAGWDIQIEKHIPVGSGLGGGSADAAAVLRALETLAPQPLGQARVLEIAGTLGADVAFLASATPLAFAWGRGDRLMPLPPLAPMAVTLLAFTDGVNTAEAYATLARDRADQETGAVSAGIYPIDAFGSWSSVAGLAVNEFESVTARLHAGVGRWLPAVRHAAARLSSMGAPAIGLMSGSGASCFVLRPPSMPLEFAPGDGMHVIETRTLSRFAAPTLQYSDD